MSALSDLIARVEGLTEPSRRIDAEVAVAVWSLTQPTDSEARILDGGCDRGGFYYEYGSTDDGECDRFGLGIAPLYTSDIGVVMALSDHAFPGRPVPSENAILELNGAVENSTMSSIIKVLREVRARCHP